MFHLLHFKRKFAVNERFWTRRKRKRRSREVVFCVFIKNKFRVRFELKRFLQQQVFKWPFVKLKEEHLIEKQLFSLALLKV